MSHKCEQHRNPKNLVSKGNFGDYYMVKKGQKIGAGLIVVTKLGILFSLKQSGILALAEQEQHLSFVNFQFSDRDQWKA